MSDRREVLTHGVKVAGLLLAAGLWPGLTRAATPPAMAKGAFNARSMAEVMKSLGLALPAESKEVSIQGPDIAENGAVVPLVASTSIGNARQLLVLVEKNPSALVALFNLTPEIDPSVNVRVKMGQSSNVYAVAVTADGKVLYGQKEIKVTLGGCGG
jgi:sulfur-oxidizing protein SoxY